jgi:triosephosphate isomerase
MKFIIANWKMHIPNIKSWQKKPNLNKDIRIIIAPPFPFLNEVKKNISWAELGAQDVFYKDFPNGGAFTGEVSASMLKYFGVKYVIIGHSERRKYGKETDEIINEKILLSLKKGFQVILCIGEPLNIRLKGISATDNFLKNQLKIDLNKVTKNFQNNIFIAYEPIWAIGSGRTDSLNDITEVAGLVRKFLATKGLNKIKFLYGGSVSDSNVGEFLKSKEIDGVLVGSSSVDAKEFKKILNVVLKLK